MVSDVVTTTGAANNAARTSQSTVTLAEDFSQFLQLLTTQLQNQDPLSPMDSNQFTEQLVQFSQVEQSINTNSKLDDLVSLSLNQSISSAVNYIGKEVEYVSAEISYDGETPTTIRYSQNEPGTQSFINIYTEDDQLVYSSSADPSVGVHEFTWNGTDLLGQEVGNGTYVLYVDTLDADGNSIDTTTVVSGKVRGVEQQNGVTYALVGERAVDINTILNIQEPNKAIEEPETTTEEESNNS